MFGVGKVNMLELGAYTRSSKPPIGKEAFWSDFNYCRDNEIFGEAESRDPDRNLRR